MVLVPVTVLDRHGASVTGLPQGAFTLKEDGAAQPIRTFAEEEAPVSLGIVLDLSGSMGSVLGTAKDSLRALLESANPIDEAFVNTVSTRPRAFSGFSGNFEGLVTGLASEPASGRTALIDTIHESLSELRGGANARKALLVISDGMDNESRWTKSELMEQAIESDAQIYTIAFEAPRPMARPVEPAEARIGQSLMADLARKTGGISFIIQTRQDIARAVAVIDRALRSQYAIGYVPGSGDAGKWHKISVRVAGAGNKAYARAGYRLSAW
jgi:Ca-activated chloride channel family protein